MNTGSGLSVSNLAKWNGTWNQVERGVSGPVYALAYDEVATGSTDTGISYTGALFVYLRTRQTIRMIRQVR